MNEVYGICINRNLILSRGPSSFFFPLHFASLPYFFSLVLLLSPSPSPPPPSLYPAFSNFLGSSLLPSGEIYKAVERRVPLKSRQSVDFCRGTELETSLSLSFSPSPSVFLFLSVARWLSCSLSLFHTVVFFFRRSLVYHRLVRYLPYAFNLFALALLLANVCIS